MTRSQGGIHQENEGGCRALQEAGNCLHPSGSGELWVMARGGREGAEEVGQRPGPADWTGGGSSHSPSPPEALCALDEGQYGPHQ